MKIILNNKFKKHLEVHTKEFSIDPLVLINNSLDRIKKEITGQQIEQVNLTYDFNVGKIGVVETSKNDKIIWKRREGYTDFSRFVLDKEKPKTNIITFILNKSYKNDDYFILTCFPSAGIEVKKEIFDKRINCIEDFNDSKQFWSKHAFILEGYKKDCVNDFSDNKMFLKYFDKLLKRLGKNK